MPASAACPDMPACARPMLFAAVRAAITAFCGDADAAWCAVEAASGRCVRQQREAPLLSLVEVVRDGKSLWVPSV